MKKKVTSLGSKDAKRTANHYDIKISKLGIVSHDYRYEEKNGFRDFSYAFGQILKCLDDKGCDSVLFSLYTLVNRKTFDEKQYLKSLKNIRSVFIEEFEDNGKDRNVIRYVVYNKIQTGWSDYELSQKFGTLEYTKSFEENIIKPFNKEVKEQRIFGNYTVLLCGESNIVKYSKTLKAIEDKFNFLDSIPSNVKIILNPIHDRMTRFEMKLKRKYLSENGRWFVSVWNKGKQDKNGKVKDGKKPPWTVFYNGNNISVEAINSCSISSQSNIEIGILDTEKT